MTNLLPIIKIITFFSLSALTTFSAYATDKYVTDDINIYLHRGPGSQYAFSGSVKPGEKVTLLETNQDGKYSRIQNENGLIAWIDSSQLSDKPSLKTQLIDLQSELNEYKKRAESDDRAKLLQSIDGYIAKLQTADKTIADLQNQIKEKSSQLDSLTTQVDEKRQSLIQTWFIYGGGVAGAGLLLGLILPLIMPKRKHKDRWMN
ncbi:TIGR04211 family SH3 domain-containing protein [Orbaceae bacterium ESL0721]|nr:TIGR04211 family SH3 domain-containing protein [Orbaceae bacterium ESL0721]